MIFKTASLRLCEMENHGVAENAELRRDFGFFACFALPLRLCVREIFVAIKPPGTSCSRTRGIADPVIQAIRLLLYDAWPYGQGLLLPVHEFGAGVPAPHCFLFWIWNVLQNKTAE